MFHPAVILCLLSPFASDDDTPAALIAAHNHERAERKLPPLKAEPRLTEAARIHAADMARRQVLSHEGGDGSSPADRVKRQKYVYLATGENIASGQRTVAAVMDAWMNSVDHREHVLGDFNEIGVAVAKAEDGTPYWCVDFGRPYPKLEPDRAEAELIERINHARADLNKKSLAPSSRLAKAARQVAATMGGESPPNPMARINEAGYRYETIVESGTIGTPNAEETLKSLLGDDEQKKSLLGPFSDVGVGYALTPSGRPAWCIILAKPRK
jgi:uncharacterized protein YkwD